MSEGDAHQISTRINEKLAGLSKTSGIQLISRTDQGLRRTKEMAYEPEILSIGPYHRGKNNLQKMEKYKLEYLEGILKRQNESSAERYIEVLMQDEKEARSYYADHVGLSSNEFVEMMLLDGCFIIEFFRNFVGTNCLKDGHVFKMSRILIVLGRDLLLFENQVPFFILEKLFNMTKIPNEKTNLISLAISCLIGFTPFDTRIHESYHISDQPKHVFHLLSLMHDVWCYSFAEAIGKEKEDDCILDLQKKKEEDPSDIESIKSVTELKKHGIKFVRLENSSSWLDIKFENRKMKIPRIIIEDGTESVLRNLVAYEQYKIDLGHAGNFVTDYTALMDSLINTAKDVEELRHKGIIGSWLGHDEAITNMFNKIGENVQLCPPEFSYHKLFKKVNKHCSERKNPWIADLKSTHFKNPWSIISFMAATFLLLLTLIQTIVSILQYIKDEKVVCKCK